MKWFLPLSLLMTLPAFANMDPLEAIRATQRSPLVFKGRMLMTGSISIKTCVFENDQVYLLYGNCTRKEAPATSIKIVSKSGGAVKFAIENSDRMERTGAISTQPRTNYDGSWTVSYQAVGAPVPNSTLNDLDTLVHKNNMSACYIGGMMVTSPNPTCYGDHKDHQIEWESVSVDFWSEPGNEWYKFLRDMRAKANVAPQ